MFYHAVKEGIVDPATTAQAREIIRGLGGLNIRGMDLVEVAPAYDVGDVTALAGASLILDFICTQASISNPRSDTLAHSDRRGYPLDAPGKTYRPIRASF